MSGKCWIHSKVFPDYLSRKGKSPLCKKKKDPHSFWHHFLFVLTQLSFQGLLSRHLISCPHPPSFLQWTCGCNDVRRKCEWLDLGEVLCSLDRTGDSDSDSWQSCARLFWVQAETDWIMFTSSNLSSKPPPPTKKKETATAQVSESNMKLWCHLARIPVKPSSLPGKVIQRVYERFTWTNHDADSLHALLGSAAWNASPPPRNPLGDCILSQPFSFLSEAGHFPQSLCGFTLCASQKANTERGTVKKKIKAGKLRIE